MIRGGLPIPLGTLATEDTEVTETYEAKIVFLAFFAISASLRWDISGKSL